MEGRACLTHCRSSHALKSANAHVAALPRPCTATRAASTSVSSSSGSSSSGASSAVKSTPPQTPSGIMKISPQLFEAGGLDPATQPPEGRASFAQHLASSFLPVNVEYPGLRILNIDPPVLSLEKFLTHEECDALVEAAQATGRMQTSGVAAWNLPQDGSSSAKQLRTSTTLAITSEVLREHGSIAASMESLVARMRLLFPGLPLPEVAAPETLLLRPSRAGQLAMELPQVTRYQPGQHFLSHGDAFPLATAREKGYQRRCTLLLYLNDVAQGGATHFDVLGFDVRPKKGNAALFFPSFANGVPDNRTIHTAQDAVDEKWVSQLWLSVGLAAPAPTAGSQQQVPSFVRGVNSAPASKAKKGGKRRK